VLTIIEGRSKSGKTNEIFKRICSRAKTGRKQILIVPESASHESERALCINGGDSISLSAEVLTFKRLANRVFAEAGGLSDTALSAAGRIIYMYRAASDVSDALSIYKAAAKNPEFLTGLIALIDEMKSYNISPEALNKAAGEKDDALSRKVRDIAYIYSAYSHMTREGDIDPRDIYTRLAEKIDESSVISGKDVYIDGFSVFTGQEYDIVRKMLKRAENVTIAITYDSTAGEDTTDIFSREKTILSRMIRMANADGIKYTVERLKREDANDKSELSFLEDRLFRYEDNEKFEGNCDNIRIYRAKNAVSECEYIASEIKRLVREKGIRYRDTAVLARDIEDISPVMQAVFDKYDIPLFLSGKNNILQKSIITFVLSAIDTVKNDFAREDLFLCLKTGFPGITDKRSDIIENYAILWNIRGAMWTREEGFTQNPNGYRKDFDEEAKKTLSDINAIRADIRDIMMPFRRALLNARTGRDFSKAVYEFCERCDLSQKIEDRADRYDISGRRQLSEEYRQIYDILIEALSQIAQTMGESEIGMDEFRALLSLALSQYEIGTIPVSIDGVSLFPLEDMGGTHVKHLFFSGANDGLIPMPEGEGDILSDIDRERLEGLGIEMGPKSAQKTIEEMGVIYKAVTSATDKLTVSYRALGKAGEEMRPSFIVTRLMSIFPNIREITEEELQGSFRLEAYRPCVEMAYQGQKAGAPACCRAAFYAVKDDEDIRERIEKAAEYEKVSRMPVRDRELVKKLYGDKIYLTASRTEKFKSCKFSYFMQYGLRAKERRTAGFDAPEIGSFVHYILENVTKDFEKGTSSGETILDDDIRKMVQKYVDKYTHEILHDMRDKSKRFIYLFNRLKKLADAVAINVIDEIRNSDFKPEAFELDFSKNGDAKPIEIDIEGGSIAIVGKVDRVDTFEKDGKKYIRVVDYKTGSKSFSVSDVWHGLNLQMLIYLFAMIRNGGGTIKNGEGGALPAGILYIPARDPIVRAQRRDITDDELSDLLGKTLKRSGLILNDEDVIDAMEKREHLEDAKFLPIKILSDGTISSSSSVATLAQFGKLQKHVEKTLHEIGEEIIKGDVTANPYYRNTNQSACDFCEFASACLFDQTTGIDKKRYLYPVKQSEFWDLIGGEKDGGSKVDGRSESSDRA